MSYTGPGSVVPLCDEFLTHWQGVNDAMNPAFVTVVPEGKTAAVSQGDLHTLRDLYFTVQSQAGTSPVLDPPAPQYPSVTALRNQEEQGRAAVAEGREQTVEIVASFNRKVRGSMGHTTFPEGLPALPAATDGLKVILNAADDVFDLWVKINGLAVGPLFAPPLTIPVSVPGTNDTLLLTIAAATTRVDALRTGAADIVSAENGLSVMRPHRDNIWEREIRPILLAYVKKIQGDFLPESPFVVSLPRIYPLPGHTPDAVNLTGGFDEPTNQGQYFWSPSSDPLLSHYELRQSPGPEYDSDASTVIATIPPAGPLSFNTTAGFETPGQTSSAKLYVVLSTGNERGSNTVTLTRPA
jgi:hypothetical protein